MRPLTLNRLRNAEHEIRHLVITAENGTTIDDILTPEYWAITSRQLVPGNEITVRTDDEMFYAKLLVRAVSTAWARVHLLSYSDLQPKALQGEPADDFKVEWGGGHHKYRVRRLSDNEVVSKEHPDKQTAEAWLKDHRKATA